MVADNPNKYGRYRAMRRAAKIPPLPAPTTLIHNGGPQQHAVLATAGTIPYKAVVMVLVALVGGGEDDFSSTRCVEEEEEEESMLLSRPTLCR